MANVNITSQEKEITQIKLKNNEQYYLKDDAVRTAVSNIQVSLSTARNATSLSNTELVANDSFETAIGKLHTGLGTTEQVVETGLNNLDERLNKKLSDYSKEYLTFTAVESGTFTFSQNALQYSLDNGATWTTLATGIATPTVTAGSKIMWKQTGLTPNLNYGIGIFYATGRFEVSGNIMSLHYGDNFIGQTSLSGKNYVFYNLFNGNNKLISVENLILPATTLADYCYSSMFYGCTSLTTAPELPATELAASCYSNMFRDCTSLTTAPKLPATTLAESCYLNMFSGCAALTTAPELPATTLVANCYQYMFWGCTLLNYIKCLATNISASNCTNTWVTNVAVTGTFITADNAPSWVTGYSGIPSGWAIYTDDEYKDVKKYEIIALANKKLTDYSKEYLTFTALESGTFVFSTSALQYSLDGGSTWTTLATDTATSTISAGSKILWKQTGLTPDSSNGIGTFSATGNFEVSGNIMSLYYGDDFIGQKDLTGKGYAFYSLFNGNNKLISAENLILPATTLAERCYQYMFRMCTALTTAPELPATTLATYCYYQMFYRCTALTTAPELTATALKMYCYQNMFQNCTSLTTAPELPATTLVSSCYNSMFSGCTTLTTAPELPATTLASNCYSSMFEGCTLLTTAPKTLPATTLQNWCYANMFSGCTSLTTAPELHATRLAENCYNNMFNECTSLNYIKCLATDISATACTKYWISNVASTGTFVKAASMSSWTTGSDGIPTNWTVYTDDEYKDVKKYEIVALEESIDAEFESTASILDVHNRKITALETALGDVEAILQSI